MIVPSRFRNVYFNPRTREGCDDGRTPYLHIAYAFQSTHPRRVRLNEPRGWSDLRRFQSTHPRRVRRSIPQGVAVGIEFQSTHPRRVRHLFRVSLVQLSENFNPRTREGCDVAPRPRSVPTRISIHAPAKGATVLVMFGLLLSVNFNPRTREGCDNGKTQERPTGSYFNPRTREGCDRPWLP